MKIKPLTIFLICFLLFGINSPAIASCKGSPPGECYRCEGGVWVKYGDCLNDGDCSGCEVCAYCWCQIYCKPIDCIICMDDSCQCSEVVLNCFYDICCVVVGNDIHFSAGSIPYQCTPYLFWNAPGGDPPSQEGGGYFTTHWDTPGEKTVTVSTPCGSYDSKTVHVCPATELCCNGACGYDIGDDCVFDQDCCSGHCDLLSHKCVECELDTECEECEVCFNGFCFSILPCPPHTHCDDHSCVPDCNPSGGGLCDWSNPPQ